jgi:hypothetical protein
MRVSTGKPRHVGREAGLVKRLVEVRPAPHSWARPIATAASAPRIRGQQSQLRREGSPDHSPEIYSTVQQDNIVCRS